MSNELLTLAGLALVILAGLAVFLYRKYISQQNVLAVANAVLPDVFEPLVDPVIVKAYNAVEQRVKAYGAMTNEQRLELGKQYAAAIYGFYKSGKLTPLAIEALLEDLIFSKHG
jgi:hypothetical protein